MLLNVNVPLRVRFFTVSPAVNATVPPVGCKVKLTEPASEVAPVLIVFVPDDPVTTTLPVPDVVNPVTPAEEFQTVIDPVALVWIMPVPKLIDLVEEPLTVKAPTLSVYVPRLSVPAVNVTDRLFPIVRPLYK